MKHRFFQLTSFITYWLDALDAHSLHSPFYFDFYTKTVRASVPDPESDIIEELRSTLVSDSRELDILDLGSGSTTFNKGKRAIKDIARTSLSPHKYSGLYKRIIQRYGCMTVAELGTSLGINTLYLASGAAHVSTFEGSPAIADVARALFDTAGASNIDLIEGNIEKTLPEYLRRTEQLDFAFLDANHRYQPTLDYFDWMTRRVHSRSVIILDDIYYSPEMANAWKAIQRHEKVRGTADLYRCGIVFFDPSLNKQHVVLQF